MLVCADQELCKLPNRPLGEKDGHECRLGCGGRLHGICGEPEEEGGQEIHRVCNPCIAKKQKTPGSSKQPKRASPESELAGDGAAAKKTKPAGKAAGKAGKSTRTRLNFGQQLEVLKLLDEKTTYAEIARRYSISTSAISLIKGKRQQLEQAAATNARSTTSKSSRRGDFPELEKDVLALIEEARRVPLPITRATIESFGIAVRDKLAWAGLDEQPEFAETLSEDAKEIFMEKVNNTFKEDENISDDDDELDSAKDSESAGGGGKKAPPSFAELADFFGPLEQYAESCGIGDAGHFLRKAKMAFLAATFARPARQLDIRVFADS
ncbi:unnamed protein product [Ectocarpus sp. CCAP 1310/34]|nr:unnamed protein product [Ectocarpus sp. CCAP 1310/34]